MEHHQALTEKFKTELYCNEWDRALVPSGTRDYLQGTCLGKSILLELWRWLLLPGMTSCWLELLQLVINIVGSKILNNYWLRLNMISWIIKTEVCVKRAKNGSHFEHFWGCLQVFVLWGLACMVRLQKQKRSIQPFCFWGEHSKGLSNQAEVELDIINAISAADIQLSCQVHKLL